MTVEELIRKSMAGIEFITITPIEGGIKIRRKKLMYDEIRIYAKMLIDKGIKDLFDINHLENTIDDELKELDTIDKYLYNHSGYLGKSYTLRDFDARSISLVQEGLALLNYIK